jgi:dUTP pyrophosphatase
MINIQCKLLHENAVIPYKAYSDDACFDFFCVSDGSFVNGERVLRPFESHVFDTGVTLALPQGYAMYLWDRSGMAAKRQIHMLGGVIDETYRGNIMVCLINLSGRGQVICEGDKIIQGQLVAVPEAVMTQVDELPVSQRGENGFGSTGQ